VLALINDNATNSDPTQGVALEARLAAEGNGIELVDRSTGTDHLTVTRNPLSTAAIDLGLVPEGQDSSAMTGPGDLAQGPVTSAAPNSGLLVRAVGGGTQTNGARIVVEDCGADPSAAYIHYSVDPDTDVATIAIGITPGVTTANDVVRLFQYGAEVDPEIRELFTVGLDPDGGSPNTGEGVVDVTPAGEWFEVNGGSPDLLTGADVNPQETEGLLTALARLQHALATNDLNEMNRAMTMLDESMVAFHMSRTELAMREQGLDALGQQLDSENIDLEAAMSADGDVDMADAVTQLTAKQVAYEASLRAIGQLSQFTLLDFI
jgi:flagellin-like hook-associated protein FlgL